MDIDGLLELLDIESPEDFAFFEYFAELTESREDIPFETLYQFFSRVEPDVLDELTRGYFEELLDNIPEDQIEFYTLMDAVGINLAGLAQNLNQGLNLTYYTEEFFKFRIWYLFDSKTVCRDNSDGTETQTSVADAIVMYRLEKLGERAYSYDFSACTDYPLEEYAVPVVYDTE
ncbi:MAG: hypothetical protein LBL49_02965 [Clostridiales Family XIII bacterium]|jgi:hypothetical protein|nr:hypothetical protein [Clostridiales Family XIII bacterium]